MSLLIGIIKKILFTWIGLSIVMLPFYFKRKKTNPDDKKNTLISLLVKALIASVIITLVLSAGLFIMFFQELNGYNLM